MANGIEFSKFREWVSGDRVLDGDLTLTGANSTTLKKVNFGGKFRRLFWTDAKSRSTRAENEAVRRAFQTSASEYIENCDTIPADKKNALLAMLKRELTSETSIGVALSRRTVRMVIDAIDALDAAKAGERAKATKSASDLKVKGLFGDFTLTKKQYTAMFEQVLLRLESEPDFPAEKLSGFKAQVGSYLAAFEKNGSLGNLGVFFMGSMDMESVIAKMERFFNDGVLPPRSGKSKEPTVRVLSEAMTEELKQLRILRMTEGDNALASKVDITHVHPENAPDVQSLERQNGVPRPQPAVIGPAQMPPAARLVADLIFNENLLEMQERQFDDGERIIQTLSKDFTALRSLCQAVAEFDAKKDTKLVELEKRSDFFKYLSHVCQIKDLDHALVKGFLALIRRINKVVFGGNPSDPNVHRGALYSHCDALYDVARELNIEKLIDDALSKAAKVVSRKIESTLISGIDDADSEDDVEALEKNNDRLLIRVLPKYFAESGKIPLRRMFALSLRQSTVSIDNQIEDGHIDYGAFLMGSGPYMLKLLQGLDIGRILKQVDNNPSEEQQQIISGANRIKSQMPGLEVDTIYAHLLALGQSNSSMFDRVELRQELGAASVGVTYDCKVTIKNRDGGPAEEKNVVLKMLRPGVEEQLDDEIRLMQDAGDMTGLRREVDLTTASIHRELDLKKEFKALQKGLDIYAKTNEFKSEYDDRKIVVAQADRVDTVKPVKNGNEDVAATENCMIMERAPGVSVASYLDAINAEAKNKFGLEGLNSLEKVRNCVVEKREKLEKLHSAVLQVAAKLVDGLFPKKQDDCGYFHGDLHAGNMMYDEERGEITLIDYGKGTWLEPSQSDVFRKLLALASVGNSVSGYVVAESLVNVYEQIMRTEPGNDNFKLAQDLRDRLMDEYGKMTEKGLGEGIELLAGFGRAAANVGADLPLIFFDFFATCGKLSSEIRQIEKAMSDLDSAYAANRHFQGECKSLIEDLFNAFNQNSLFAAASDKRKSGGPLDGFDNDKLPFFPEDSVVGQAIGMLTENWTKVKLDGLESVLKRKKEKLGALQFDDNTRLDPEDFVSKKQPVQDKQEDNAKTPTFYRLSIDSQNEKYAFAKKQMCHMLKSVATLKGKMGELDEYKKRDVDDLAKTVTELKGSAEAFRKMITSHRVKEGDHDGELAFKAVVDECQNALDKMSNLDKQIKLATKVRDEIRAFLLKFKDDAFVPSDENVDWIAVLKGVAIVGFTGGTVIHGKIEYRAPKADSIERLDIDAHTLQEVDPKTQKIKGEKKLDDRKVDEKFVELVRNGNDEMFKKYAKVIKESYFNNTVREYWQGFAAKVEDALSYQINRWTEFKSETEVLRDNAKKKIGANGALVAESHRLVESPEVIENRLLKAIDVAVARLDALSNTMKSDLSIGRTAYRGNNDAELMRSFNIYKDVDAYEEKLNFDVVRYLYPNETVVNKATHYVEINKELDLNKEERAEYVKLFNHLKPLCAATTLQDEGCPDPNVIDQKNDNGPKLTRKNLLDLRYFARYLDHVIFSSGDPVTAMMQNRIGNLFGAGIGKQSDEGGIKVVTDRLDKLREEKLAKDQIGLFKELEELVSDFGSLKLTGTEKDKETVGKLVAAMSKLKTRDDKGGLVKLEIERLEQETGSELRYLQRIKKKDLEAIRTKLKEDFGDLQEEMKSAGIPEDVLVCAVLRA